MKLLFLFLFSLLSIEAFAASCCVSNTSVSNLMILPSKWQETFTVSQFRVIGDVNEFGTSTFRRGNNRDWTNLARLDLAYGWNFRHQTGVSLKYSQKTRMLNGTESKDSGWNDIGLSHAYRLPQYERVWFFQNLNIPTARSAYDSRLNAAVDARGTGTWLASSGLFGIHNFKNGDLIIGPEIHHSFSRTFNGINGETRVGNSWGSSLTMGAGYIPWKSRSRFGIALTPRYEATKEVRLNGNSIKGKESLVWDSSANYTYSWSAEFAVGINYTDQTLVGPVRNTLLNRAVSIAFQTKWL